MRTDTSSAANSPRPAPAVQLRHRNRGLILPGICFETRRHLYPVYLPSIHLHSPSNGSSAFLFCALGGIVTMYRCNSKRVAKETRLGAPLTYFQIILLILLFILSTLYKYRYIFKPTSTERSKSLEALHTTSHLTGNKRNCFVKPI